MTLSSSTVLSHPYSHRISATQNPSATATASGRPTLAKYLLSKIVGDDLCVAEFHQMIKSSGTQGAAYT